ncbi:uL30 family ribosomal protein [Candidatus Aenigmatarchaeota archaeon]
MLAAIRLRGKINIKQDQKRTMDMLGIKKINSMVVLPRSQIVIGMLKKVESFITWGEVSDEVLDKIRKKGDETAFSLKPPKKGLKSIKKYYPKGDLGYRGDKINALINRMI